MSGPKHLWSGDWENESEDTSAQLVREPQPEPEPPAAPPRPAAPRPRRSVRPRVLPVAIGAIVIAAAAFGLSRLIGSSDHSKPSTISANSPLPPPHPTGSTRPIVWLGMEIITGTQGVPVVETVAPNSNGDQAGLEPGDSILLINNHAVGSTSSITDAIKGLHSGDRVTLAVNNGGAVLTLVARLADPPHPYP